MKIQFGAVVTQEMVDYILKMAPESKETLIQTLVREGADEWSKEHGTSHEHYSLMKEQLETGLRNMFGNPQRWKDIQRFPQVPDPSELPVFPLYN